MDSSDKADREGAGGESEAAAGPSPRPSDGLERTAALMTEARRILAYGGFDGVVRRPLFAPDGTPFPQFAADAKGCEITDTLGRVYIDWVNGWGPVMLGYRRPEIDNAVRDAIGVGPTLSLMHPIEIEVARALTEMFPCAEMVAFGKNGSDVVTAAVRVARAATGRDIILHYGMHGFHDWYICVHSQFRGLPSGLREQIESFPYNDVGALKRLFEKYKGRVAAVVMEPVREELPKRGYLSAVRELTHKHGALLIWDEIVTALRIAPGGAQEYFGLAPDMACLGKSLGNGLPLSALVGKREVMKLLPSVGFGMTFRGEAYSLAAALAVLRFVRENDVAGALARTGEAMRAGFDRLARKHRLTCYASGLPQRLTLVFRDKDGLGHEAQREFFVQECMREGVLTNGNLLPSFAHEDTSIERSLTAMGRVLARLKVACDRARRSGRLDGRAAVIAHGFVETLGLVSDGLLVSGWLLMADRAPDSLVFIGPEGHRFEARTILRPDLESAYPEVDHADCGGFELVLPAATFARSGAYSFRIEALVEQEVVFSVRAFLRQSARSAELPLGLADGVLYV